MPNLTNTLISASAGTGKTYQLSLRFLALLALDGGTHPERLIAVTFTRKAAGEFKDRILTDLAAGAATSSGASHLTERLWAVIRGEPGEPGLWPQAPGTWKEAHLHQSAFRQMLRSLVQHLARLNLCTIDSLFAQIASASTFELGVSGFGMIDSTTEKLARREALIALYRECSANREQSRHFETAFLSGAASDAEATNAEDSMTTRLNAYHELFLDEPDISKWGNAAALGLTPDSLTSTIPLGQFNDVLHTLINSARNTPAPEGKTGAKTKEMFLRFLNGFALYAQLGVVRFRYDSGGSWTITIDEARDKFADFWSPLLDDLIQSWLSMEAIEALGRTRSTHGLMAVFEKKYASLVRNRGRFLFHDITRLLGAGAITQDLKRNLQYRMYCRYDHWLLDEFQDTSQSQWRVLKPFLDDLADDREDGRGSIFVVGDIKQSVYQWRGGDPGLFRSVAGQLHLNERGMATSYRSVQPVLDMVNDICDYARTAPDCEPAALNQWGDYPQHNCASHLMQRSGCAQIWQTPKPESDSANNLACRAIADILRKTNALQKGLDTAVLVSTRKQALTVREWLTKHGWPAEVCDDVPVGVDSPLGQNLLYFFRWLLAPGDNFSAALLNNTPLQPLITPTHSQGMDWSDWHMLLEREGYSAVMEELESRLARAGRELSGFHQERLAVWINEAAQIDETGMPLDEWIRHMEDLTRREDPAAGVVRIMTIHKSKGLGFDIVILPQIGNDSPFADTRHLTHFVKRNGEGHVQGILMAPTKHVYTGIPQFRELYEEWKARQQFDGFCKLYVALTRAKRATYAILPHREDKGEPPADSIWKIIRSAALKAENGMDAPLPDSGAKCLYSRGTDSWHQDIPVMESQTEPSKQMEWPTLPPLVRVRQSPSGIKDGHTPVKSLPAAADSAAFGTDVHAVFERITRWDERQQPEWARHPVTKAEQTVADCMSDPTIRELFTPPASARIMKEQRIEAIEGDLWISGVIDRLTLDGNTAVIVDFKTDRVNTADELRNRHQGQMKAYARIVSSITGIPGERIDCIILSTHLKAVIAL